MRIQKDFTFDAAHHLPHLFPPGHPNHRLHGHSYRVRVALDGAPDPASGLIQDFGALGARLADVHAALDHRYLNEEVPDLGPPSLENLARWIWRRLAPETPGLAMVGVYRDSAAEGCEYHGELDRPEAP